jgi:murein DD-endopeptidase MepM/ murein hydrolase activator NlpD
MIGRVFTIVALLVVSPFLVQQSPTRAQGPVEPTTQHTVSFGETLQALSKSTDVSVVALAQRNGLSVGNQLMAGQVIVLPAAVTRNIRLHQVQPHETLSSIAATYGISPYTLRRANSLPCGGCVLPGTLLHIPMAAPLDLATATAMPSVPFPFVDVKLSSTQPKQGDVLVIRVDAPQAMHVTGRMWGRNINFASSEDGKRGEVVALLGIDALAPIGSEMLVLTATTQDGVTAVVDGRINVQSGAYVVERVKIDSSLESLLDPSLSAREETVVLGLYHQFTPQQWWDGPFQMPVKGKLVSSYGNRRIYNGIDLGTYHSGFDYSSPAGTAVRSAAPGRVLAVEKWEVRGNAIVIDHGRGVFTGYFHLSKTNVKPGQLINAGDVIGAVGTTGRSQGNHLHFDLAVGGTTVNPSPWFETALP